MCTQGIFYRRCDPLQGASQAARLDVTLKSCELCEGDRLKITPILIQKLRQLKLVWELGRAHEYHVLQEMCQALEKQNN
jgi:hypothetical protein